MTEPAKDFPNITLDGVRYTFGYAEKFNKELFDLFSKAAAYDRLKDVSEKMLELISDLAEMSHSNPCNCDDWTNSKCDGRRVADNCKEVLAAFKSQQNASKQTGGEKSRGMGEGGTNDEKTKMEKR